MSERRLNKAHDVFEMWHKKNPRTHLSKDLSGTPQDFEEYMCCVGHADEIIYDSDKWEKDKGQYIPNPSTWINQGRWDDGGVDLKDIKSVPKTIVPQWMKDEGLA